ncbi:MAG: AMP-binding protein, partial [Psychrosphaera sp.]|nr:AMP-binding protein [Psychrosphaera sp.]
MKITSLSDIEQIEKDHPLDQVITVDNTYAAIANSAKQRPEQTALSFFLTGDAHQKATNISYGELLKKITQTANMLDGLGLKEDDVVAYILPNLPETHYVIWGGEAKCRILAINPLLESSQIQSLLNSAKAKVLITMNPMPKMDLWHKVEQILPYLDTVQTVMGVDIAHYVKGFGGLVAKVLQSVKKRSISLPKNLQYIDFLSAIKKTNGDSLDFKRTFTKDTISSLFCTGGTTGLPKIALRTHRNELVNATSVIYGAAGMLDAGKTILCGLPLFHVNATLITGLIPFMNGATVVLVTPQGFRGKGVFENFWQIIERFKVTTFSGVPTVYSTLLQHPVGDSDISSLEYCMCGAAPMPVEIFK